MIPLDDRGLLLGDGLFETLLAVDGAAVDLGAHLDRMAAGCTALGLPDLDRSEAAALVAKAIEGAVTGRAAVRLTLTAGSGGRGLDRPQAPAPRLFATAAAAPVWSEPARLATSTVRRNEGSPASRWKTLAYLDSVLARREAVAAGADEALMLNVAGEVACAAAANVFWIAAGRLFTPDLACGVLAGVMRGRVLRAASGLGVEAAEVRARPGALEDAEAVFLTNSLIGVRPVAELDGRSLAPSRLVEQLARTA